MENVLFKYSLTLPVVSSWIQISLIQHFKYSAKFLDYIVLNYEAASSRFIQEDGAIGALSKHTRPFSRLWRLLQTFTCKYIGFRRARPHR